jgi:hypothetical protein
VLLFAVLCGCAKPEGPEVLLIDAGAYNDAFDAAMEVSRSQGMPPALRDRRRGVIETEPTLAGSILDPWRGGNDSLVRTMENTIAFQRLRARFEFTPAGSAPRAPDADEGAGGPDLLATETPDLDLSGQEGALELRVRVFVEKAHTTGVRRDTWSRRNTTRARIDAPASDGSIPPHFWTPVGRDPAFERRMLAAVDRALTEEAHRRDR